MTIRKNNNPSKSMKRFLSISGLSFVFIVTPLSQDSSQKSYPTPNDAMNDMVAAVKTKDVSSLQKILGPQGGQLLPNNATQQADIAAVAENAGQKSELVKKNDAKYIVKMGNDGWPFPVPIIKDHNKWRFDTEAGIKEVSARYIGGNELDAVAICKTYAVAQWDYFLEGDWDLDSVPEFSQRLISTPGNKDGLYWPNTNLELASPLGKAAATAGIDGSAYTKTGTANAKPAPFSGYYFKILKAQGSSAAGGAYSYIVNGNMINGFALVAYPAEYGKSGIMTFIVNQQGRVYEKNLGNNTSSAASAITTYNPDKSWKLVF